MAVNLDGLAAALRAAGRQVAYNDGDDRLICRGFLIWRDGLVKPHGVLDWAMVDLIRPYADPNWRVSCAEPRG